MSVYYINFKIKLNGITYNKHLCNGNSQNADIVDPLSNIFYGGVK